MKHDRSLALVAFFAIVVSGFSLAQDGGDYRLRIGDRIRVTVFGEDELTTEAQISRSGVVNFKLIGAVPLTGKTVNEAVSDITTRLSPRFVVDAKVTLTVTEYADVQAIVVGSVRKPGPIILPREGELDLLAAIGMAGGFSEGANKSRVSIRRRVNGTVAVLSYDVRLLAGASELVIVEANDIVSVPENIVEQVTVLGEVKQPGVVEISDNNKLDLLKAIAMAGGFLETANPAEVLVARKLGSGNSKIYRLNTESMTESGANVFLLQRDDVITVSKYQTTVVTVMGEVNRPGVFELPKDRPLSLLEVIAMAGGYTERANPRRITVKRNCDSDCQILLVNGKRLAKEGGSSNCSFPVCPRDVITVAESFF